MSSLSSGEIDECEYAKSSYGGYKTNAFAAAWGMSDASSAALVTLIVLELFGIFGTVLIKVRKKIMF